MIIIHVVNHLPRHAVDALEQDIRVMPVVIVTGARQTGKSTLVRRLLGGMERL
jgi:predicted AAA+ superfamily ATPase